MLSYRLLCVLVLLPWLAGCSPHLRVSATVQDTAVTFRVSPVTDIGEVSRQAAGQRMYVTVPLATGTPEPWRHRPRRQGNLTAEVVDAPGGQQVRLTMPYDYPVMVARVGQELRLKVVNRQRDQQEQKLDDQVTALSVTDCTPQRVRRCFAIRVAKAGLRRVKVVTAGATLRNRRTVADMAAGATAAINGGFFDTVSGAPLGAVKIDGEWLCQPLFNRTALLLGKDGSTQIAPVTWHGKVIAGGQPLAIDQLNSTPKPQSNCAVMTRFWDGVDRLPHFFGRRLGNSRTVVYTREELYAEPQVELQSDPDTDGSILGAGPRLVRGGEVEVTKQQERFRPDIADAVTARSGCGLTADGDLLLAFGEGTAPYSAGWSLEDWAAMLRRLGCRQAMGLDGHTMACLVVDGQVLGHLSGGSPQAVATALVVSRP